MCVDYSTLRAPPWGFSCIETVLVLSFGFCFHGGVGAASFLSGDHTGVCLCKVRRVHLLTRPDPVIRYDDGRIIVIIIVYGVGYIVGNGRMVRCEVAGRRTYSENTCPVRYVRWVYVVELLGYGEPASSAGVFRTAVGCFIFVVVGGYYHIWLIGR